MGSAAADNHTGLLTPLPDAALAETSHTYWSRREGAPGGITALAQTKDGYLWIGSTLGLYRFDGLKFSQYPFGPTSELLPEIEVSSLAPDADGGLWAAFRNRLIIYIRPDGSHVSFGPQDGLDVNMLEKVIVRPGGEVFTYGGGKLLQLAGKRWIDFGNKHGLGRGGVFSVFFDRSGDLWVGRDKKLCVLHHDGTTFEVSNIPVHYVSSMAQSKSGELWIADAWRSVRPITDTSPMGVLHIQGKAEMLLDSNDDLWIAEDDEGLSRIRRISSAESPKQTEHAVPDEISALRTHALLEDREGNIWLGTDRGLDRFQKTTFASFRATQLHYFPSMVAANDGSVWINSHGSSLMRVHDGVTTAVGPHVNTGPLARRANGEICFINATTNVLQCYGENGLKETALDRHLDRDPPINMIEDADGTLLASFLSRGLWRYKDDQWTRVSAAGLPQDEAWGMMVDSHGNLWLGYSDNRVIMREKGVYRSFHVVGDSWGDTLTFYEFAGTVWAAGPGGLCFFRDGRMIKAHSFQPDLFRGTSGIAEDKLGNLWLNSGAGALRIASSEVQQVLANPLHSIKAEVFDDNDGLIGQPTQSKRTPSVIVDGQGKLWFATGGNIVTLAPATVMQPRPKPIVLVESITVNGAPAATTTRQAGALLSMSATRLHDLEISYIGINLSAPERVYYRYRLVNEDKDWQDAGTRRQAFYTRLRPGTYRFEVSASNGQEWSGLAVPLQIEITPAFYQSWWFLLLTALTLGCLAWVLIHLRTYYATEQIQAQFSARMAERERVARELHDTLLQGFQGLMMRFDLATRSIGQEQNARAEMEEALDRADELLIESRDRIRDLRYESLDRGSLPQALDQLGHELVAEKEIEFSLSIVGYPCSLNPVSYQEIFSLVKEAMVNAVRHSGGAHLGVSLHYEATRFTIRISDDGRGIDAATLNATDHTNHWGLAGMRERAANLKGALRFVVSPNKGTTVCIQVPSRVAYRSERESHWMWRFGLRRVHNMLRI